jgi:hypothetical protein
MRSPLAGLVVAVALAAGCGGNSKAVDASDGGPLADVAAGKGGDGDGHDGGATLADAPVSDAADAPADVPADAHSPLVSFVFTNSTSRSIYIQTSGFSTQGYWSLVQGGTRLPVDNMCETCDCTQCQLCPVCGRALARVEEIPPGAQHRWTWDGRIWEPVPNGCGANIACDEDEVVPAGAALGLTVTYATSFVVDTSFGADDQFIGAPLTTTVAFTNAPGASIEISATQ